MFDELNLIMRILAFVRQRGEVTSSDIQATFGTVGTLLAGFMTAQGLLMIVGGGGSQPYLLRLTGDDEQKPENWK